MIEVFISYHTVPCSRYYFLSGLLNKGPVLLCLKPFLILYLFFPCASAVRLLKLCEGTFFSQMHSQLLSTLTSFSFLAYSVISGMLCDFWISEHSQVIPACVGITHAFLIFIYHFALDFGTVWFIHFILCLCEKSAVLLDFVVGFFWWTLGLQSLFPPPEPNCTQRRQRGRGTHRHQHGRLQRKSCFIICLWMGVM